MEQENRQKTKRQMRREVMVLCLIFVLYLAITGLIGSFVALVAGQSDGGEWGGQSMVRLEMTAYLGTYILMLAAPLGIFFVVKSKEKTTEYLYVNRPPQWGATLLGCVGVLAVNYIFTILSDAGEVIFARMGGAADPSDLLRISDDPVANVLYFFALVLAPAVLEEFCFRGVICGRLAKYNRTAAVLISSILFAVIHMTVSQIPFAFAAGLLMGYVYLRTGSIWSTVVIHAVNNGFAYLSEYLFYRYDAVANMESRYMLVWAAIFVVGLVCLVILGLSHKDREDEPMLTCGQAMAAGSSSAMFIVCVSLALAATMLAVPLL